MFTTEEETTISVVHTCRSATEKMPSMTLPFALLNSAYFLCLIINEMTRSIQTCYQITQTDQEYLMEDDSLTVGLGSKWSVDPRRKKKRKRCVEK